jgi:hypothetical protein
MDMDYFTNNDVKEEVYTLDEILEKISHHGIESLTRVEREILDNLSKDNT